MQGRVGRTPMYFAYRPYRKVGHAPSRDIRNHCKSMSGNVAAAARAATRGKPFIMRATRGLYAGKSVQFGHNVSFSQRKYVCQQERAGKAG